MIPFAHAVDTFLTKLMGQAFEQISGVPDDDLNSWRPRLAMEDINTFYALLTHTISAGEYWILHGAGGQPTDRNRPAEFRATGSRMDLIQRGDAFITDVRAFLETLTEEDLARVFERAGDPPLHWTAAECIVHAVEHTAVHVGHLQLQRQIWNAERRTTL
jgi:uncharacterized damage-inducible protein DinB